MRYLQALFSQRARPATKRWPFSVGAVYGSSMSRTSLLIAAALTIAACGESREIPVLGEEVDARDAFWFNLTSYCGKAYRNYCFRCARECKKSLVGSCCRCGVDRQVFQ